ncbi:MAG: Ig domain-containing protein, partial [Firmicutes bacterium]|nr:Ig domain-containing protein [Bacillota bacterium]
MKDIKRRAIALTLALALNLSMAPAVFANDEMPAEEVKQEAAIEQIEKVEEIKKIEKIEEIKTEAPAEEIKEEVKAEEQIEEKAEEKVEAIEEIKEELKAEKKVEEIALEAVKKEAPASEMLEKKLEELPLEVEKKEAPVELEAVKEELPKAEIVPESTPVIVETAQEELQIVEEAVEEEPAFVSDAVKMTVSGGLSKYYLEAPENTTKFTAVNKNASNKNAEDQNITWTSSDESLATVDETGLVTFHATTEGTVKITATPANADIKPVTKNITIKHLTLKDVTYTISTPITVYAGAEQAYSISFTPNYALDVLGIDDLEIYWSVESTDGKSEATISEDGVLNPITPGKIKVKALLNIETGTTAAKNITIKEPILVNRLTMSPANVTLKMEGETVPTKALKATVSPTGATNKNITWTSSDESVATVSETGLVTAVGEGTAVITAASESNPDVTATSTITVEDLNNKKYTVTVKHYFTKTFACDEMYNGVPSPYEFMVEGETRTVKHGETVDAANYIMDGPQRWPHIFTYNGQKYMMGSSYVAAKGAYGDIFEATSDIDIIFTYSAIAQYSMTFNFLDKETGEKLRDSAVRSYEFYEGYVEKAYNYTNTINKSTNLEGYTYMGAEGEVAGSFTFENANKTINLYF